MSQRYSPEAIAAALELAAPGDRPLAQVARELGISESSLRRWVRQQPPIQVNWRTQFDTDVRPREHGRRVPL